MSEILKRKEAIKGRLARRMVVGGEHRPKTFLSLSQRPFFGSTKNIFGLIKILHCTKHLKTMESFWKKYFTPRGLSKSFAFRHNL